MALNCTLPYEIMENIYNYLPDEQKIELYKNNLIETNMKIQLYNPYKMNKLITHYNIENDEQLEWLLNNITNILNVLDISEIFKLNLKKIQILRFNIYFNQPID